MPLSAGSSGNTVMMLPGTRAAGYVVRPYYDRHWDGVYSYFYTPPEDETNQPFACVNGKTAYCSYPVFSQYHEAASTDLRGAVKNLLDAIFPEPLLRVESGLPSYGRAFVSELNGAKIIHFLNYVPELRGKMLIVEEGGYAKNVAFSLRLDGFTPEKVYIAPDRIPLEFSVKSGRLYAVLPEFSGYAMIVAE